MPPAPGAEANHGFADAAPVPATSAARQQRAKVAGKIVKRQQQARMAADAISAPAKKDPGITKRVRISTGRPRGRPRKAGNHGFADDDAPTVGGSSSSTPGMVAASQDAAASGRGIRIVPVSSSEGPRRGRGRPRGSVGIKKRTAAAGGGPMYVSF